MHFGVEVDEAAASLWVVGPGGRGLGGRGPEGGKAWDGLVDSAGVRVSEAVVVGVEGSVHCFACFALLCFALLCYGTEWGWDGWMGIGKGWSAVDGGWVVERARLRCQFYAVCGASIVWVAGMYS